jgi:signal recognition particle receptor subunit beta
MSNIIFATRRYIAEIVYWGPGLSGKTTTLEQLESRIPGAKLVKEDTAGERTVFFDLLPLTMPMPNGWTLQFNVKSVPGQVQYVNARRHNLQDPDAVVFVADSLRAREDANILSFHDLRVTLAENGRSIDSVPIVFQYNRQDLRHIMSWERMQRTLNPQGWPAFASVAVQRRGIIQPLGAAMMAARGRAMAALAAGAAALPGNAGHVHADGGR